MATVYCTVESLYRLKSDLDGHVRLGYIKKKTPQGTGVFLLYMRLVRDGQGDAGFGQLGINCLFELCVVTPYAAFKLDAVQEEGRSRVD